MSVDATPAAQSGTGLRVVAGGAAALAFLLLAVVLLFDAAGPLRSDDLWWHLSFGNVYLQQGPWLDADPLLYTALGPPHPNSWLFDVIVSGVASGTGLNGLRVLHVLAVAAILALVCWVLRRECKEHAALFFAASVLAVLMGDRLLRLRPELFSMAAVLVLYGWLFAGERPPSWRRVAAAVLLVGVWANFHAAFAVGPLLLAAALAGMTLRFALERGGFGGASEDTTRWLLRLGAVLALGGVAALLNPRGIDQHLSYFTASAGPALASIGDDWVRFDPLGGRTRAKLGLVVWAVSDALLLAFLACSLLAALRLWRRRDATALRAFDPALLALGAASWIAIFVSQRFLWLSIFPLLYVLRSLPILGQRRRIVPLLLAALAVGLALTDARGFRLPAGEALQQIMGRPVAAKYPVDAVRFLADTGVEGHLFGRYSTGAFLGHWLAPQLRTSVNGTLNFPAEVFADYFAIVNGAGVTSQQSFRETLARHDADLFLGEGVPEELLGAKRFYTTILLEADPDWLLVYRRPDAAIYLRRSERNRENLERIAAYYAQQGLFFDPERGLEVGTILWGKTDWAIRARMLPTHYPQLVAASDGPDPRGAHGALSQLATLHMLLGDYSAQVELDRRALELGPRQQAPRRRLIFGLLRLGRIDEALAVARSMVALAPQDPVAAMFLRAVELEQGLSPEGAPAEVEAVRRFARQLPVLQRGRHAGEVEAMMRPPPTLEGLPR